MEQFLNAGRNALLSLLRLVTAFLYMQHGGQKLVGYPTPVMHEFELLTLGGFAGVPEVLGGFLVLIGLCNRATVLILAGLLAFTAFMANAPQVFWPVNQGSELALMFCFSFLYLLVAGGGKYSVDYMRVLKNPRLRPFSNPPISIRIQRDQ